MKRPAMGSIKSSREFSQWYWLKEELVAYCRKNRLQVGGDKATLTRRIKRFINNGERTEEKKSSSKKASSFDWHSDPLTARTKITDSYKNTQNVRRFMKSQVGDSFHFSIPLMQWVKENEGKSLKDLVRYYQLLQKQKQQPGYESKIPAGNEYNQYTRDFMRDNPGLSIAQARKCWAYKRSVAGSNRYQRSDLKKVKL
jgi:hypothetical protein